jgi:hypothetical protein
MKSKKIMVLSFFISRSIVITIICMYRELSQIKNYIIFKSYFELLESTCMRLRNIDDLPLIIKLQSWKIKEQL